MIAAPWGLGLKHDQKNTRVLAFLRCLAMADQKIASDAKQMIGMVGDVSYNDAGLAPSFVNPVCARLITFSALRPSAEGQGDAHRRPRDVALRDCSLFSSQVRTVLRR